MSNKIEKEKVMVSGDTVYLPSEYYPYGTTTDNTTVPDTGSLGIGTSSQIWMDTYTSTSVNISTGSKIYNVFDLPRENMPIKVYVCGRIMTMGLLGTNVECAYTGGQLIFEPGIFTFMVVGRNTLSVEYKDEIYHYNVTDYSEKKLLVELVSTVNLGDE